MFFAGMLGGKCRDAGWKFVSKRGMLGGNKDAGWKYKTSNK